MTPSNPEQNTPVWTPSTAGRPPGATPASVLEAPGTIIAPTGPDSAHDAGPDRRRGPDAEANPQTDPGHESPDAETPLPPLEDPAWTLAGSGGGTCLDGPTPLPTG